MNIREIFHTPIHNDQIGPIMVAMLQAEQARIDAMPEQIIAPMMKIERAPVVRLSLIKGKVCK